MKINWVNFIIYLGIFMIGCLFCWFLIKYIYVAIILFAATLMT